MSRSLRTLLLVLVGVLAIGLAAAWVHVEGDKAESDAGTAATRAARSSLQAMLTYTPETVASDLEVELDLLAGDFRTQYERLVRDVVAPAAIKGGVTTSASVVDVGVVAADAERVTLVVFVNVTTRGKALGEPRLSGSRLLVKLVKVGSAWHVSGMDPV
jgi:Mce-associated membrane protein